MRRLRAGRFDDSGAAAVELALVMPLLILLVMGVIRMGQLFNTQISFTAAAREGVRTMAIENDAAVARQVAIDAAPTVLPALTAGEIAVSPGTCSPGSNVQVTVTRPVTYDIPLWGTFSYNVRGVGVMRCGG